MKPRLTTFEQRAAELKARLELQAATPETIEGMDEEPLTPKQAAPIWGKTPQSTRRYFMNVEGVRITNNRLLIPPSVLRREIRRVTKMPVPVAA